MLFSLSQSFLPVIGWSSAVASPTPRRQAETTTALTITVAFHRGVVRNDSRQDRRRVIPIFMRSPPSARCDTMPRRYSRVNAEGRVAVPGVEAAVP